MSRQDPRRKNRPHRSNPISRRPTSRASIALAQLRTRSCSLRSTTASRQSQRPGGPTSSRHAVSPRAALVQRMRRVLPDGRRAQARILRPCTRRPCRTRVHRPRRAIPARVAMRKFNDCNLTCGPKMIRRARLHSRNKLSRPIGSSRATARARWQAISSRNSISNNRCTRHRRPVLPRRRPPRRSRSSRNSSTLPRRPGRTALRRKAARPRTTPKNLSPDDRF